MHALSSMWLITLLVALVAAAPVSVSQPAGSPEDPSTDPFYQPPAGFEATAPGTILHKRKIAAAFFGLIPEPVDSFQLLYRTAAVNGSAISTVTTVFKPKSPKTDRLVSFHTEYDSSSVTCNPSYQHQLGAPQTGLIPSVELPIIQTYLLKNYIVTSPDYEGPDAAFGAARLAGMAVLDGMRAVARFEDLNLTTGKPAIVGAGYSGGAIATGWAAALHSTYAPELNIKGWAQGGTPSNLTGTLMWLDNSSYSGFLPAAIDGLSKPSAYGARLKPFIDSIVTSAGQLLLDYANSHCAILDPNFIHEPIVETIMAENILAVNPDETPIAPVFAYHAALDDIIPYGDANAMITRWCDYGANVSFTTYADGGHISTELHGIPEAVRWVERAFEGDIRTGCPTNTISDGVLERNMLGEGLKPILEALSKALDVAGKEDESIKEDISVLGRIP